MEKQKKFRTDPSYRYDVRAYLAEVKAKREAFWKNQEIKEASNEGQMH